MCVVFFRVALQQPDSIDVNAVPFLYLDIWGDFRTETKCFIVRIISLEISAFLYIYHLMPFRNNKLQLTDSVLETGVVLQCLFSVQLQVTISTNKLSFVLTHTNESPTCQPLSYHLCTVCFPDNYHTSPKISSMANGQNVEWCLCWLLCLM